MNEKTRPEKIAADHQVKLLANALEQAKEHDGVWLNPKNKRPPMLHDKYVAISGFNSLILSLNTDAHNYDTNIYTSYYDSKQKGIPVMDKQQGVPFNWYKWREFVNRNNPNDVISRSDYQQLSDTDKLQYKMKRECEHRWLFNIKQTIMPKEKPDLYSKLVEDYGSQEVKLENKDYADNSSLISKLQEFEKRMRENLVDIRYDGTGLSYYDTKENAIHLANRATFARYPDYIQELMRNVVAATGHQQRLARQGLTVTGGYAPSEDAVKQEKLIQELTSGLKMSEMGLPARISGDNLGMIDYWVRELKEDPCLIDIVERDVNSAADMIRTAERGVTVEMASEINAQKTEQYKELLPKHFYIADEIKLQPDENEKLFVVVRDNNLMSADVVLPAGASLESNNEISGMSKNRISTALEKQGYSTIRFYNPDGALGYRPDDSYFAGKEVMVSKLKNWKLIDVLKLDINDAVSHADKVEFDRVQMVQDDKSNWALFVKPEGREAFTVYPDKADINRFFTTLKQADSLTALDDLRLELGNKYLALTEAKPELKIDLFGFDKQQILEADIRRIQKVNLFKGKSDDIMCAVEIEGVEHQKPRVVSPQQWQRMWLAEDREVYKKNLAATLFSDVLEKARTAEVVKDNKEEEKNEEKIPWNWSALKEKHPTALLMFRTGDFYSMYNEDAQKSKELLGLNVEKIKDGVDKASFPYSRLDTYLPKLIRSGCRVAICDLMPEPEKDVKNKIEQEQTAEKEETRSHGMRR